jgi:hypothetical protein
MNWTEIFDSIHFGELIGATEKEISKLYSDCKTKLNNDKSVELPSAYIEFLKFCNTGITTVKGEREIQFFTTEDLVEMNLAYEINKYMPGAISIAMDGCGNHIIIDVRNAENEQLYSIHSGDLDWNEIEFIADNFICLCEGIEKIDQFENK